MSVGVGRCEKKLDAQTQEIVETVIARCKNEKDTNQVFMKVEDYLERSSYYTGLPTEVIKQIHCKTLSYDPERKDCGLYLSIFDQLSLSRVLKSLYSNTVTDITYEHIMNEVYKERGALELEKFTLALINAGYQRVMTSGGRYVVMECPKKTFERVRYLKKIQRLRSMNKHIYYLDARIFNKEEGHIVSLESITGNIHGASCEEMIFYYAISADGCKNKFYCFDKDLISSRLHSRLQWIMNILIPILEPSSVLVVNNNSFLGTQAIRKVTEYDSKKSMINWLKNQNVPCNPNMCKAELYDLIEKCSVKSEDKSIDTLFKSHGHEVLRLPHALKELNPTEPLWEHLNKSLKLTELENALLYDIKQFIDYQISVITEAKWQQYEDVVISYEKQYYDLDMEIEVIVDKLGICSPKNDSK